MSSVSGLRTMPGSGRTKIEECGLALEGFKALLGKAHKQ